ADRAHGPVVTLLDALPAEERRNARRASMPEWTAPMLATLTEERFSYPNWIFERKFGGIRCLAFVRRGNVRLLTRKQPSAGERYTAEASEKGWEGMIGKLATSAYEHGRSRDWLKLKCVLEQEFVIGGYTEPQGSRTGLGAVLVGTYRGRDLVYAGKVGTGFD